MLSIHCFIFLISLFGLSAILKIRNGEHAHYVGLVVAYTWNREKQMFVALGKEFDMRTERIRFIFCFSSNCSFKFISDVKFLIILLLHNSCER